MAIRVWNRHHGAAPGDAVYIGRPSALGNPFRLAPGSSREERDQVIRQYEEWLRARLHAKDPAVCLAMNELYRRARSGDVTLVCHCAPLPCHGDVVARVLEEVLAQGVRRLPR